MPDRIGRCGHPLTGRQSAWCSVECRKKAEMARRTAPSADSDLKFCKKCQRFKTMASFNNDAGRVDGKFPWCRACRSKYTRVLEGRDRASDDLSRLCPVCDRGMGGAHPNARYCSAPCRNKASLARMYGMTIQQYQQVLLATGGKCPICWKKPKRWCIDHNHATGEAYGPCCDTCNTKLIAWTLHDPEVAARLLEFLRNPPIRALLGPTFVTPKKVASVAASPRYRRPGGFPHGLSRHGVKVTKPRTTRKRERP